MKDTLNLLSFNTMLTPFLIRLVWWIGVALFGLTAVFALFISIPNVGWTLAGLAVALAVVRILCELAIIQFAIHENLTAIRKALDMTAPPARVP